MNNKLIEILSIINDGLRGEGKGHNIKSPSDNLCTNIGGASKNDCNAKGMYDCNDCPIGFYSKDGHATQLIQVWKQL